jgi:hypothetical protein
MDMKRADEKIVKRIKMSCEPVFYLPSRIQPGVANLLQIRPDDLLVMLESSLDFGVVQDIND